MEKIEVIDLSEIGIGVDNPSQDAFERTAKQLNDAFSNIGFAYIKNHGIDVTIIQNAFRRSYEYFCLEESVKNERKKGLDYQGWVCQGREIFDQDEEGKLAENELREAYDVKNISPKGKFPDTEFPPLRPAITELAEKSRELTGRLLTCLSLANKLESDFFAKIHVGMISQGTEQDVDNASTLRSIHYPPIRPQDLKPGNIRCGEHSDYGTITLLFQDDMGGLEVKSCSGKWVQADPIPGCIVINVGDLLENMTNGKYPATRHRVKIPEEELRRQCKRQSIAFFVHPDDDVMIRPLAGPNDKYPPVTARQHLENRFSATYGSKLVVE